MDPEDLPALLTEETWTAVILADGLMATDASNSAWAASPADSAAPGWRSETLCRVGLRCDLPLVSREWRNVVQS